jgi:hypothetical protein
VPLSGLGRESGGIAGEGLTCPFRLIRGNRHPAL